MSSHHTSARVGPPASPPATETRTCWEEGSGTLVTGAITWVTRTPSGLVDGGHSERRATTGSSRPARRAGATPKKTPTATDTPKASRIDHQATAVGNGENRPTTS